MKRFTPEQVEINRHLTEIAAKASTDTETRVALFSAMAAFSNYINHGVKVDLIEGDELIKEINDLGDGRL